VADRGTRGAVPLAGGFFGSRNQTTRGDERLHPRAALDRVDCVQQYEGQDVADPRARVPAVEGGGVVRLGRVDEIQVSRSEEAVVGPISVRSTALRCWTAGSGNRAATPSRFVSDASGPPSCGRLDWLLGCCRWASRPARWRLRCIRRRRRSLVARIWAGETSA